MTERMSRLFAKIRRFEDCEDCVDCVDGVDEDCVDDCVDCVEAFWKKCGAGSLRAKGRNAAPPRLAGILLCAKVPVPLRTPSPRRRSPRP